jgi:ankyrin repeat protein
MAQFIPLHDAASRGDVEKIKEYIAQKVDVKVTDESGESALHRAAANNQPICARVLVEAGALPNAVSK